MTLRIFLSHNKADNDLMIELYDQLIKNPNWSPALDLKNLEASDLWRSKVHAWLDDCDVGVVVCSEAALKSGWVRHEIEVLCERRRRMLRENPSLSINGGEGLWPKIVAVPVGIEKSAIGKALAGTEMDDNQSTTEHDSGDRGGIISTVEAALAALDGAVAATQPAFRASLLAEQLDMVDRVPPMLSLARSHVDWRRPAPETPPRLLARHLLQLTPCMVAGFLTATPLRPDPQGRRTTLYRNEAEPVAVLCLANGLSDACTTQRFDEFCHPSPENSGSVGVMVSDDELQAQLFFAESRIFHHGSMKEVLRLVPGPLPGSDPDRADLLIRAVASSFVPPEEVEHDPELAIAQTRQAIATRRKLGKPTLVLVTHSEGITAAHLQVVCDAYPGLSILINTGRSFEHAMDLLRQPEWQRFGPSVGDLAEFQSFLKVEAAVKAEKAVIDAELAELAN